MAIETLIPKVVPDRISDDRAALRAASTFSGAPLLQAIVTAAGTGLSRTLTVQVANQKLQECRGLFAILLVIGNAADGPPAGTTTIGSPTEGELIATITADKVAMFFTETTGRLVVQLTQAGVWTPRYPRCVVIGPAQGTTEVP